MYNTMNPSAHPSYSHYYLLSPSTLFFFFFCTSYCFFAHLVVFLHIFLHILLFCTFFISLHILLLFLLFLTICMPLCYVTLYNLYSYYFALSTERTWFDYISLLIIPCITIMWQIKKPWTLNLVWKRTKTKRSLQEVFTSSPVQEVSVRLFGPLLVRTQVRLLHSHLPKRTAPRGKMNSSEIQPN